MATVLFDAQNSFVRFNEQAFLTDNDCGVIVDTCLPISEATDLIFQFRVATTDYADATAVQAGLQIRRKIGSTLLTLTGSAIKAVSLITGSTYLVRLNFSNSNILNGLSDGDCFQLQVNFNRDEPPAYLSADSITCFKYTIDKCFTSRLDYKNNESAFGFIYSGGTDFNRVRLPMYSTSPSFDIDQQTYGRSNGIRTKVFARLAKKYKFVTDFITEEMHQKLVVALNHDTVQMEVSSNDYFLECTFENEYNQDTPTIMQVMNVWPADFQVYETPFNEINNNCG